MANFFSIIIVVVGAIGSASDLMRALPKRRKVEEGRW